MKRESKLLLRIIFLLAVLYSPVINVYSSNNIHVTIVKHPAVDNCEENISFPDVDFFDDEQINPIFDFFPESDYLYQIRIPQDCILISRNPTSIWQPPKIVWFNV
jgi:disulfide bond formation protein DsbB